MEKIKIKVPKSIRYLSDWKEFDFSLFPEKCIIDKEIPGCGYTEWCIRNNHDMIISSPRKMLLQNKEEQHKGEVFLVTNYNDQDLGVDIDLYSKSTKVFLINEATEEEKLNFRNQLYLQLKDYITSNVTSGKKSKILVTYDSYYIVKGILEELGFFKYFWTVVDEMQVVLSDSRFKSTTEVKFMEVVRDVQKVHFVSATPILKKYLEMIDDFKDLPYYELDWVSLDPNRVQRPDLKVLTMKSVGEKLPEIIKKYQDGIYDSKFISSENNGVYDMKVFSDEAVFYVNSVRHIISAIKKCQLSPDEVNILCADTPLNQKKIKSLGKGYSIGQVPLKGVKPKKYTFCTRTVYLGADFYSECARTFIFADSNIDCLAVDISQDLPQIIGRQRLRENPWKNSATLYYRSTSDYNKMTEDDFNKELQRKKESSESLLRTWINTADVDKPELSRVYEKNARVYHYKEDYVAVTNGKAVFNQYAYISDIRAFDIQQKDYADRFTVFSEVTKQYGDFKDSDVADVLKVYINLSQTYKRLELLCEFYSQFGEEMFNRLFDQVREDDPVKEVFKVLGPDRCKANGYDLTKCRSEMNFMVFDRTSLDNAVYSEFHEGDRFEKSYIKEKLQKIFDSVGYKKIAKATSIEEWFEIKPARIVGKTSHGFELIRRK